MTVRMVGAAAALFFAAAGCGSPEIAPVTAAPAASPSLAFDSVYRDAAASSGVPAELLHAIAVAQTGEHVVRESESGRNGLMGLTDAQMSDVAPHLGVSAEQIAADPLTSARAAAWIVADRRAAGLSWNEAALSIADLANSSLRARWLIKVNRVFDTGAVATQESIGSAVSSADYGPAAWVPASTSNYTAASRTAPDLYYVVIHDVEGTYEGAISWFQNPAAQVSAHFVTSNEGNLTQMVSISDIAWHAGNWNYNQHSVGIEHEGYASDPASYPEPMYVASATLTRWLADTYAITRDRTHILGHVEVPGATHHDPGPYWNWDHYMELVNADLSQTATLVGYVRVGDIYTGTPVVGATVTLDGGLTATTDANGYYQFDALALGTYTVTASAEGFLNAVDTKIVDSPATFWKSLAVEPDNGNPTPTPTPGGNGGTPGSSGHGGCSVGGNGSSLGSLLALGALALMLRRRA